MIKTKLLIAGLAVIVILVAVVLLANKTQNTTMTPPINISGLTPTLIPTVVIPQQMQKEKIAEENYSNERRNFLTTKPWILKLPFKSVNYFISYNPENDLFLATIYYSTSSAKLKNDQLDKARSDVTGFLKTIDSSSAGRIKFAETFKKGIQDE